MPKLENLSSIVPKSSVHVTFGSDLLDRLRLERGHQLHVDEPFACGAIQDLGDQRSWFDCVTKQIECPEELIVTSEPRISDEASHGPRVAFHSSFDLRRVLGGWS